jgi:hypothetical protein
MRKLLVLFLLAGVSSYAAVSCDTNVNTQAIYGDEVFGPVFGVGDVAQGCLTADVGVNATGSWSGTDNFQIAWRVSIVNNDPGAPDAGTWAKYEYSLYLEHKALSHWILELSSDCTAACVQGLTASAPYQFTGPTTFSPTDPGNSNPGLPASVYGVKFDVSDLTSFDVTFYSLRLPIWQNFYAKDGKDKGMVDVYAYNRGFGLTDTLSYYIATPDTREIPEPGFYGLLSLGLAGIYYVSRRRKGTQQPQ